MTNPKVRKISDKAAAREQRKKVDKHIKNAEKKPHDFTRFHEHMINRDEIAMCSTIVGDKLYIFKPMAEEVFLPFIEDFGDHGIAFIVCINTKTGEEKFRRGLRTTDMIEWKLSSSETKTEKENEQKS